MSKQIRFESNNKQWFVVDKSEIDYDILSISNRQLKIIAYLDEISEEQAREVVEQYEHCVSKYKNYLHKLGDIMYFNTPIESLHSLLKSKGVDIINGDWLLLKITDQE